MALIFDLECDGFLEVVSKIHCLVIKNSDGNVWRCDDAGSYRSVEDGVRILMSAQAHGETIVGHNILKFDLEVIKKLYPWFTVDKSKVLDTLVCTRLIWANIKDIDAGLLKQGKLPGKLFGKHTLESWGYRLGEFKGEYADWFKEQAGDTYTPGDEWLTYCEEMGAYCEQDVEVTAKLYERILSKDYSKQAIALEHSVAWLMAQQERNGFHFDEQAGAKLYAELSQRRGDLERQCRTLFDPWTVRLADFIPKRDNKRLGYTAGVPAPKYKTVEFNPGSRDHIANRLQTLYGWVPEDFTDGGKPKVDEEILGKLTYEPCKLLTEYLTVAKRISQLAEGDQAWLKLCKKGRIHGSINPNGAVTGRATHAFPNISQVPASSSPYGHECRALFGVPAGWTLVGADASGLELRCLAHFMARYDDGAYGKVLLEGDIHTVNQQAAGLQTRPQAKTFIYAFLYGAGDAKIGSIVNGDAADGKRLKSKFLRSLPALGRLVEGVREAARRGYLRGIDGRLLHVRSSHAALNTLLQSAGAIVCKQWLVYLEEHLQSLGLKHGWDGDYAFCAWSHDEVQIACRTPELAATVAQVATDCVPLAGQHFNFRCPTAGESKTGLTWADTH